MAILAGLLCFLVLRPVGSEVSIAGAAEMEDEAGQRGIYGVYAWSGQPAEREDPGLCDAHHPGPVSSPPPRSPE